MKKIRNLQPWLDYFEMLHQFEKDGFLQADAEKHEAYVTRAALFTVAGCDGDPASLADRSFRSISRRTKAVASAVRRLRAYAAWLSRKGGDYLSHLFALHVVQEEDPHDLLFTIILTSRRRWWKLWMWHDHFEVISYDGREEK